MSLTQKLSKKRCFAKVSDPRAVLYYFRQNNLFPYFYTNGIDKDKFHKILIITIQEKGNGFKR
ncbi:MAG: hypothetical protein BA867_10545 [Desulfobacterales bacterium S5133MH16]|nr:MAG: hypothetical protein BA867_10545 [Desulfobacterales bacterium S5133MH16]